MRGATTLAMEPLPLLEQGQAATELEPNAEVARVNVWS